MKCISVYTNNFEAFSDIFEEVMELKLEENEEKIIEGVTISESGDVPEHYLDRMKAKSEVVVMKVKENNITILQHGGIFEILVPAKESVLS